MLLNILGWFWIISGVIFLFKPELMRNKMKKKSVKKLKKIFSAITLLLGILMIKAAWGVPGVLAKVIVVLGFIGLFKAIFFLKAKSAENLIEWYLNQSLKFFRISAAGLVIMGAIFLTA